MNFEYEIKRSGRTRRISISVYYTGKVVISAPLFSSEKKVKKFLEDRTSWVISKLEYFKNFKGKILKGNRKEYEIHKASARRLIKERLVLLNQRYNFTYGSIKIRNQKTRWGSCTKDGNLSFNYRVIHLPEKLRDYIIVHELCHLKEFNHSKKFWELVAFSFPDHKSIRTEVGKYCLR